MRAEALAEVARIEQTAAIARQNDQFRAALAFGVLTEIPGQILITPGVAELDPAHLALLQLTVAGFAAFTEENDPYGDHSFGAVEVCGTRVFWKIDLYDETYTYGSEEPANPERTRRVLTMLLPAEY